MNKPMIENSERGFTVNKPFAWSVLGVLIVPALSVMIWAVTVTQEAQHGINAVSESVEVINGRQIEDRATISRNSNDIRALQSTGARIDERLLNIERSQERSEDKLDSLLGYVRSNGDPRP